MGGLGVEAPALVMLAFLVVILGAPPSAGPPIFFVVFGLTAVGIGLIMSSMIPLGSIRSDVLEKYDLNPLDTSLLMNSMLIRAAFRKGGGRSAPDEND